MHDHISIAYSSKVNWYDVDSSFIWNLCSRIFFWFQETFPCLSVWFSFYHFNTLVSGCFWGFSKEECLNPRGFAREYLCSCTGYRPGRSVKTRQVLYIALENIFLVRECGFFVSDVISGGLLGHLGPLFLGPNH